MKTAAEIDPALAAGVCEPDAGLRPEHQLLHVEQHREPVRHGDHRRVSRPLRLVRRGSVRGTSGPAGGNRALDGLYVGANCPLSPRLQLRTLRAGRQARHQRPGNPGRESRPGPSRHDSPHHVIAADRASPSTSAPRASSARGSSAWASTASGTGSTGPAPSGRATCSTVCSPAASSTTCRRFRWMTSAWSCRWTSAATSRTTPDGGWPSRSSGTGSTARSLRLGYEQRLGRVQLRGGARYIKERWEPTGGAGYNFTDHFGDRCRPVQHERQSRTQASPGHRGLVAVDDAAEELRSVEDPGRH